MHIVTLNCNHCGAPLEVPAKTRYVTCAYCSARLEVHRSGNAVYSEVLEAIDQRTERIAEDVEAIKLQNDVEQLDREWLMGLDRYKVRNQDGHYQVPGQIGAAVSLAVAVVFGLFWIGVASSMGAPFPFPLFGLLFIVAAVVAGANAWSKAAGYQRDHASYQRRRRDLLRRLRDRN